MKIQVHEIGGCHLRIGFLENELFGCEIFGYMYDGMPDLHVEPILDTDQDKATALEHLLMSVLQDYLEQDEAEDRWVQFEEPQVFEIADEAITSWTPPEPPITSFDSQFHVATVPGTLTKCDGHYTFEPQTLVWGKGLPHLEPGQVLKIRDVSTEEIREIRVVAEVQA